MVSSIQQRIKIQCFIFHIRLSSGFRIIYIFFNLWSNDYRNDLQINTHYQLTDQLSNIKTIVLYNIERAYRFLNGIYEFTTFNLHRHLIANRCPRASSLFKLAQSPERILSGIYHCNCNVKIETIHISQPLLCFISCYM